MFKRRKKNIRQRAGTTHGWGSMKKHRGAGHRGGRGAAGSGKRGDAKKPRYWKDMSRYGKHGFTSHAPEREAIINVGHLASAAERMVAEGLATKQGETYALNLTTLGIERLLGAGIVNLRLNLTVTSASEKAVEKVQKAGGKVTVTGAKDVESADSE